MDRNKTTFTCRDGAHRFVNMPFELCNAPTTLHQIVYILLLGYKWQHCLVYIDDVTMFSETVEDHVRHFDEIITIFEKSGFTRKLKKI